jgi:hypothetical protein
MDTWTVKKGPAAADTWMQEGILVSFGDYRLNAQVRAVLVRRNIDLTRVEHGVTNSVIYIRGSIRSFFIECDDLSEAKMQEVEQVKVLEKLLRSLPGVRDVVFNLDRVRKVGSRWKPA